LILASDEEGLFLCCSLVLIIFALIFWIIQFVGLMSMPDAAFPGRFDKPIWATTLILLNFVGALLFWFWKQGKQARQLAEADVRDTLDQAIRDSEKPNE
ncbi:MAG: hypothetical protein AAF085_11620, partial [Planctomycetota bacterium]